MRKKSTAKLAGRVRELKETLEGLDNMCREMDEIYNEGIERGLEKGNMEMKQDMVLSMFNLSMPVNRLQQ